MKSKTFLRLSLFLGLVLLFPARGMADKIYLNDGKVYEGKIVGKSDRRYLLALDTGGGDTLKVTFFTENIAKVELSKDTVEKQIPYLKEVETTKMGAPGGTSLGEKDSKAYEFSLYKKDQAPSGEALFSDQDLKKLLAKDEYEYYDRYNEILRKYSDRMVAVQNVYANLTTATKEDLAVAKQYMDELYFDLNSLSVPAAFKKSHVSYLTSVKATYLAFGALEQGMLEEASKQIKISDESRQRSAVEFRDLILSKKNAAPAAPAAQKKSETAQ